VPPDTLGATERAAAGGPRPADAETMVGLDRLDHLQGLLVDVLRRDVPGDVIELGVWRGGTTIFMRGLLKIYGESQRTVWVADSFAGPPKPDSATYPADSGRRWWAITSMAVSLEEVQRNFERYGLLDQQVRFLPGYFRETLPTAPIERLSLMRLDAVMYESTIQALDQLYPKMSPGGYVVVDDYSVPEVRSAVADYRAQHGVTGPIEPIDARASYWRVAD
jgi:O-methyltransferase